MKIKGIILLICLSLTSLTLSMEEENKQDASQFSKLKKIIQPSQWNSKLQTAGEIGSQFATEVALFHDNPNGIGTIIAGYNTAESLNNKIKPNRAPLLLALGASYVLFRYLMKLEVNILLPRYDFALGIGAIAAYMFFIIWKEYMNDFTEVEGLENKRDKGLMLVVPSDEESQSQPEGEPADSQV